MARRWENQSRMALTGDREDSVGTVAMRQVSACSDAGGWTRRWGVRGGLGLAPCKEKRGSGRKPWVGGGQHLLTVGGEKRGGGSGRR
jgi:hypothetical protein